MSLDLYSEHGYVGFLASLGRYEHMARVLVSGTYEMRAFFLDGYTAVPKVLARDIRRVLRERRKLSRSGRTGLMDLRKLLLNRKVKEVAIVWDGVG
jgi:hypothetical protein